MGTERRKGPLLLIAGGITAVLAAFLVIRQVEDRQTSLKPKGQRSLEDVLRYAKPRAEAAFPQLESLTDGRPLALLAFKDAQVLEVWKSTSRGWSHVRDYPFAGYSGRLGPKLREGDGQIPEGIYRVELLNPNSSYHLSMKIDYPNAFDLQRAAEDGRRDPGSDIYIHGDTRSVGCIPLGDAAIEELFYLVAANGEGNTEVVIAPSDLRRRPAELPRGSAPWVAELYGSIAAKLQSFQPADSRTTHP